MELKFRCFGGKTFRPQPEALVNEELGLFSIVTPWGPGFQTKQVTESLIQNYTNFSSDKEATSIYKNLTCLSPEENILRRSILTSNEQIYKSHNRGKHYSVGYEVVCGLKDKNQILFVQIGHPAIYLDREGASLQALVIFWTWPEGIPVLQKDFPLCLPSFLVFMPILTVLFSVFLYWNWIA